MNLAGFDLNLLIVFDAMMREQNTTRAGNLVGMSQPAISKALSRLRYHLKDELFIRAPDGMNPTPRALEMYPDVRTALHQLDTVLSPAVFDPASSNWEFRIIVNDLIAAAYAPGIVEAVVAEAPGVNLRFLPTIGQGLDLLDRYEADFVMSPLPDIPERFGVVELLSEEFLVLMRADHPLTKGTMSLEGFASASHILYSVNGDARGFVDTELEARGLTRRVAVTISSFSAGPRIVMRSDMVMTAPRRFARTYAEAYGLAIRPLPFTLKSSPGLIRLAWHKGLATHKAHDWFRNLLSEDFARYRDDPAVF